MNAAILLVTTAWIAGADAAAPAAPPAAPVHSVGMGACAGGGCDAGCGACCDACGESGGLFSKLKGRFHRSGDCGCESEGLLSKLRGRLHKSEGGCDAGCDSCGGCAGVMSPVPGTMMPKAEPIGPPKQERQKLPAGDEKKEGEKKGGSVQLIPQPIGTPNLEVAPTSSKSPF